MLFIDIIRRYGWLLVDRHRINELRLLESQSGPGTFRDHGLETQQMVQSCCPSIHPTHLSLTAIVAGVAHHVPSHPETPPQLFPQTPNDT
jgi:hypothetical protein